MTSLRAFLSRLRGLWLRRRLEQEMADEIACHLDMAIEENLRRGMPRDEAIQAARRAFGGVEQAKEHQRDARSFRWIEIPASTSSSARACS